MRSTKLTTAEIESLQAEGYPSAIGGWRNDRAFGDITYFRDEGEANRYARAIGGGAWTIQTSPAESRRRGSKGIWRVSTKGAA